MNDILLDSDYNIQTSGHDLQVGAADTQICDIIVQSATGEFKESQLLGGDARRMLGGSTDPFWKGRVKTMLQQQHIEVKKIEIGSNDINIEM